MFARSAPKFSDDLRLIDAKCPDLAKEKAAASSVPAAARQETRE
jgi:hypothetical protein